MINLMMMNVEYLTEESKFDKILYELSYNRNKLDRIDNRLLSVENNIKTLNSNMKVLDSRLSKVENGIVKIVELNNLKTK